MNGSVYEFYRLKALIILKQVNTSVVEKKKKKNSMARLCKLSLYANEACDDLVVYFRCWSSFDHVSPKNDFYYWASPFRTRPVIISVFGHLCRKTVSRGRKGTGVYYRETMFSEIVSYHFFLHWPFLEYFMYLASAPGNSEVVANQEGFLRCSIEAFLDNLIIGVTL